MLLAKEGKMISSPCKTCTRKNLSKEDCIKDCNLLNTKQDFALSKNFHDGSAIDYTEEYSCNIPPTLTTASF
jgi:hypothetical protein